jgi:beta-glucosidase
VDEAVARVLKAKFRLGLFEDPYADPDEAAKWNGHPHHRELALQAGREAIVLLKNRNNVLPLKKEISSIAVIGPDAAELRLGGYSRPGNHEMSILDAIRGKVGKATSIVYKEGCKRLSPEDLTVPNEFLRCTTGDTTANGLAATYWDNTDLSGKAAVQRIDRVLRFDWSLFPPDPAIPRDWFSARWTGKLIAPVSGRLRIGLEGNDGFRLFIGDSLLIDNWGKQSYRRIMKEYSVLQGQVYALRIEYRETTGLGRLRLVWDHGIEKDWHTRFDNAVKAAGASNAVVFVAGLVEGEGMDRAFLGLPGHQPELIRAIAATGKPVIVVLVGGSAITMDQWLDDVDGVLDVWYPGEEGGSAVADVLFGDYNPAGRLPITYPAAVGQVPLFYNHKPTGRLDYYYDLAGEPLFPFGFGLSYTSFAYSDYAINSQSISRGDSAHVRFLLRNTGSREGDEVVQLYLQDLLASVSCPVRELKGFQRIHLQRGETREISFTITPEMLSLLDRNLKRVIEPGDFGIMIGSSSTDIRLRGRLTVK